MPESEIFHILFKQSLGCRPRQSIPLLVFKSVPVTHSSVNMMRMEQIRDASDTNIPKQRNFNPEP